MGFPMPRISYDLRKYRPKKTAVATALHTVFFVFFLVSILLGLTSTAWGQRGSELSSTQLFDPYWAVGPSLKAVALEVSRKSDGANGILSEGDQLAFFAGSSSGIDLFGNSRFGYNIVSMVSSFKLAHQENSNGDLVNLGTGVSGTFGYIFPMVFYLATLGDNAFFKLGVGVGVGFADFNGNVTLSDGTTSNISHNINKPVPVIGFSAEIRWGRMILSFSDNGPGFSKGDFEFFVSDASLNFGIIFDF